MYFVSKFSININRDFIIDHKRYLESWISIDDYVRNHNQSSLRFDSVSDKINGLHRDRNEWQLVDSMKTQCEWGSALNIPSSLVPWC